MATRVTRGNLVVQGGEVLTPEGRRTADLVIEGARISSYPLRAGGRVAAGPEGAEVLDATGLLVVPGFIDLQCNGAAGIDLTEAPERLWEVAAVLPRWGVTAWLPTIVTAPEAARRRALAAWASAGAEQPGRPDRPGRPDELPAGAVSVAATPLGWHFEGPFLAPERRGAHAPAHLRDPDRGLIAGWSRDAGVALATLAPELPGALEVIAELAERGVVVSLGHSAATAAQARAAIDRGARGVTHLFNAMPPLHHREPGLVGVALGDERLTVGLIADGVHVDPVVVALVARLLGERLALVTDAVAAAGAAPGPVRLGESEAVASGDEVRLADGTLAGSVLSMDRAVANLLAFTDGRVGLDAAVRAASEVPARLLGLAGERGAIRPGAVGDVVLLDPGPPGPAVVATVIGGVVAHDRRAAGGSAGGNG